jgi:hypothetical protein
MNCIVGKLQLKGPHPLNPKLMLAQINGHHVVVGNHYDDGVLGFFIPDGAIVPDKLAEEMWVKGKLAGSKKNRVKARDMNGIRSDGLFYGSEYWIIDDQYRDKVYEKSASWNPSWKEGDDVAAEVGVT